MAYEQMHYSEGKDFSIFLQGDIIRDMINAGGMSETDAALEWSRHSAEFRELIKNDSRVEEIFKENPEAARDYVKKALHLGDETVH